MVVFSGLLTDISSLELLSESHQQLNVMCEWKSLSCRAHRAIETHRTSSTNCYICYIHSFHFISSSDIRFSFCPTNFLPVICVVPYSCCFFFLLFFHSIETCLRAPTKVRPVMSIPCLIWYTFVGDVAEKVFQTCWQKINFISHADWGDAKPIFPVTLLFMW